MASFKVPSQGTGGSGPRGRWDDPDLARTCPGLVDFLGCDLAEDGKVRQRGTLLLFTEGTWLKACITDRESGYRAFVTAGSWEGLLEAVEGGLRDGGLDWRPPRAEPGRRNIH